MATSQTLAPCGLQGYIYCTQPPEQTAINLHTTKPAFGDRTIRPHTPVSTKYRSVFSV